MTKTVHVVPHSHWDREWYFTTSRSKVYLMHDLKRVLELLEAKKGYDTFILDGQASLLDDYLKWRPQDKQRIIDLVQSGNLIIGPWYTQTDQLVISGESIVRNLQYGTRICKEFGEYMNVGYVPDSFGQAASMPQIYREFGMEDTMFWRGVSDDDVEHTEYIWRGEDGSTVNVYQIPSGYYIGGAIPEDEAELAEFLHAEPFKTTWGRSSTNQVYFPNGFDQAPARENIPELIEQMNELYKGEFELEISTIEKYIAAVKAQHPELEEIGGELINGKLMRIHKTIFSSRPDLKKLNTEVQFYLVNIMEPTLVMAQALDFEYPVETVREIWKLMFENAAHDSIGSCVSDTTNEDVYMRYKQARDISENLVELTLREIAARVKDESEKEITFTLFNTETTTRSEVVETEVYVTQESFGIYDENGEEVPFSLLELVDQTAYILNQGNTLNPSKKMYIPETVYKAKIAIQATDVPSFGYAQYTIDLAKDTSAPIATSAQTELENEFLHIQIEKNGSLTITDKETNHVYKKQAILEDNGDNGDSFNYSPPVKDMTISSTDYFEQVTVQKSDIIQTARLSFNFYLPKNLEERAQQIQSVYMPVTIIVTLKKGQPTLDFTVIVDNKDVDSHRLCALFDTEIQSKTSIADHQFGLIERPVVFEEEMALWNEHQEKWNEMPVAIETCQSFVTLTDKERGVAILPKGVREYEIIGDAFTTIRLTIFRTYGFMGKEDLMYRPGRASGETVIETPDAQCHKEMSFDFSGYYYKGDVNEGNVSVVAHAANTPIQVYEIAEFLNTRLRFTLSDVEKSLPTSFSLLSTTGKLTLSVVKKAEERDGMIIRFYNGHLHETLNEVITFNRPVKHVETVDLKEETKKVLPIAQNKVELQNIGHSKFVTIYVEFA